MAFPKKMVPLGKGNAYGPKKPLGKMKPMVKAKGVAKTLGSQFMAEGANC